MSAIKHDQGKLRYDLIPPEALRELARVYTIGAKKYGDNNWKGGLSKERLIAALMRHCEKYREGRRFDQEDGQEHMASVAWCAFSLLWYDAQQEDQPTAISSEHDEIAEALDKQAQPSEPPPHRWEPPKYPYRRTCGCPECR